MEAAALYAFAQARNRAVICFAHVTNQMGRIEGDFGKGAADGAEESVRVISLAAGRWREESDALRAWGPPSGSGSHFATRTRADQIFAFTTVAPVGVASHRLILPLLCQKVGSG